MNSRLYFLQPILLDTPNGMYKDIAEAIGNPKQVWCKKCGRNQLIDAPDRLRNGWPKCCGHTMTIDHPDTWQHPDYAKN